jgi:type IV pilus assembly protein PilM
MGNFFGLRKNYFLGIDFGTSSVKVVELCYKKNSVYLSNYGWADFFEKNSKQKTKTSIEYKSKILKTLLRRMKLKAGAADISICSYKGLVVFLNMPNVKESELAEAVKFEASKYIPMPIEEVFLSWDVVSRQKNEKTINRMEAFNKKRDDKKEEERSNMQILLVVAPKNEVKKYEKIVEKVDLDVDSLELDIFSLGRSLAKSKDGKKNLIVDMGAKVTNIILVDDKVIKINHSLNTGGNEITKDIAAALNISWSRAEKFKKSSADILNNEEISLKITLNNIINEIKKVTTLYRKNNEGKINSIIISGGMAQIKGADKYFFKKLGLPTVLGNPWEGLIIDEKKIAEQSVKIAPIFSVATGLALKGVEQYRRNK